VASKKHHLLFWIPYELRPIFRLAVEILAAWKTWDFGGVWTRPSRQRIAWIMRISVLNLFCAPLLHDKDNGPKSAIGHVLGLQGAVIAATIALVGYITFAHQPKLEWGPALVYFGACAIPWVSLFLMGWLRNRHGSRQLAFDRSTLMKLAVIAVCKKYALRLGYNVTWHDEKEIQKNAEES
jgi:hypothetical protein